MSKDTKMKKRISKTRQAKMREKELKSTLKFGVKLVLILAVVIGCAQLFFYGKNVVAGRSNGPAVRMIQAEQTLHQSGFAGPILANQRMYTSRLHRKLNIVKSFYSGEGFRHI